MKKTLSEADKFFIKSNKSKDLSELSSATGCKEDVIQEFLITLPKEHKKTRTQNMLANNNKGFVAMTQAASELIDATRNKEKPPQPSHIMKIKE